MKAIQYFRYKKYLTKDRNVREAMVASLLLGYASLRNQFKVIELWTDAEGEQLLRSFPVSFSVIHILPVAESECNIDHIGIAALQEGPFIFLREGVLVLNDLPLDRMQHELFIHALTKDAGNSYVYGVNIRSSLNAGPTPCEWKNEPGFSSAIFGGKGPSVWKRYHEFVLGFFAVNPGAKTLTHDSFYHLVDSWLLKAFIERDAIPVNIMEDDPKRIHQVRSTSNLLRFHQQSMVIVVPDSLMAFIDIQRFVIVLLQMKDNALWQSFIDQFPVRYDDLPGGKTMLDHSMDTERAIDVFQYQNAKAGLLDKLRSQQLRPTGNRPLRLSDFRSDTGILVTTSPLTAIAKTKWDWRWGVAVEELVGLKRIANTVTEPSEYVTLMNERPGSGYVTESSIDDLNEIILECFRSPLTIAMGIQEVKEYFDDRDANKNDESLFYSITLRIYDLYLLGALNVIHR